MIQVLFGKNYKANSATTAGSLGRLKSLVGKFQHEPENFKAYDDIIKAQIANVMVKRAPVTPDTSKEFYLPHNPVFREGAETIKLRVVYVSAKSSRESPSLSECVKTVRIRSYSGPHFSRIRTEYRTGKFGKNENQNNFEYGLFLCSASV